jgi:predicted transglutaminase-like cysteine proteinase
MQPEQRCVGEQRKLLSMSLSAKYVVAIAVFSAATQGASAQAVTASSQNVLPPFAHTVFCLKYPRDCEQSGSSRPVADTLARHAELDFVNRHVNSSIAPVTKEAGFDEKWIVAPLEGNCHDYAVTKRHDLLQMGWPSSSLQLAEVTLNTGEHHLILVADIEGEPFILDNLDPDVLSLALTRSGYYWNRIESSDDPKFWSSTNIGHEKIRKFNTGLAPET